MTQRRVEKDSRNDLILRSFSCGREACILTVSREMPKNSNEVEGPSVFSAERGMPTLLKICLRMLRMGDCEDGKSTSKKSSSKCKTKGSLQTFSRIQHRASERVLNICGLLLQPKVSLTAK